MTPNDESVLLSILQDLVAETTRLKDRIEALEKQKPVIHQHFHNEGYKQPIYIQPPIYYPPNTIPWGPIEITCGDNTRGY
jgi:hypothetical protein